MSKRRDRRLMGRAMALALSGHGRTGDNPSVGCVITDHDGVMVGAARTADGGATHAEAGALAQAGVAAQGGTAYVTLEPCRERSAGGVSCSVLLVEAGIARVVIALKDEHPNGAGGTARLKEAGIVVAVGLKNRAARALYRGFFRRAKSAV